jgi:hypothetical protein
LASPEKPRTSRQSQLQKTQNQKSRVAPAAKINRQRKKFGRRDDSQCRRINYLAIKKYTPQVYAGVVTFFGAREEICPEENLTAGACWRKVALMS